jgi:hypothetical protein
MSWTPLWCLLFHLTSIQMRCAQSPQQEADIVPTHETSFIGKKFAPSSNNHRAAFNSCSKSTWPHFGPATVSVLASALTVYVQPGKGCNQVLGLSQHSTLTRPDMQPAGLSC